MRRKPPQNLWNTVRLTDNSVKVPKLMCPLTVITIKGGEWGSALNPAERTEKALRVESETLGPLFCFLSPIRQRVRGNQTGENNWLCFSPLGRPPLCTTWAAEPDVLTPACLSYSAEVVYSEWGTRGYTAQGGVDVCVLMYVCRWGGRRRCERQENAWWWVTKNRAPGDNGTQDIPDITPTHRGGSGNGGGGGIYWCQRPLALRGGTGASFVPSGVGDGLNRDALHREDASKHIHT